MPLGCTILAAEQSVGITVAGGVDVRSQIATDDLGSSDRRATGT